MNRVDSVLQDVRFGLRTLRRRPVFTLMALGTLALGIGAATAIFSVVEGVLLRPLPYERPGDLVTVWETFPGWLEHPQLASGWDQVYLAWPDYERWRDHQTMFEGVAIYGSTAMILSGEGPPDRIITGVASSTLFPVLAVDPAMGRTFLPGEDGPRAARLAVLGHAIWQERFGGDPAVIGHSLELNGQPFTVVGVLPEGFRLRGLGMFGGTGTPEIWIPVGASHARLTEGNHSFDGVARLRAGVTLAQAKTETENLLRGDRDASEMGARLTHRIEAETSGLGARLYLLLGASLVLLLIACGNVATLLMGELVGRRHELAARWAIGARRGRLVRQLLTESVVLGVVGSVAGILLAVAGTHVLVSLAPPLPRLGEVGVNASVLGFGVAVGILTGVVFGLAPCLEIFRGRVGGVFPRGALGPDGPTSLLQRCVISLQLALTVVLLVSGGLLLRSLNRLFEVDPGFRPEGLAEVMVQLPTYRYPEVEDRLAVFAQMKEALEAIPGVEAVSGTSSLPFSGIPNLLSFGILGKPDPGEGSRHATQESVVPGFLEVMGIPLLAGRALNRGDLAGGAKVTVVSESTARRFWPGESPLGASLDFGDTLMVVGIAGDVRHESLDAEVLPTMYLPLASGYYYSNGRSQLSFVVRTEEDPERFFPQARRAVWSVDAEAPIRRVAMVSNLIARSEQDGRFRTVLMMVFGICAACLAGAGIFGTTARAVSLRSREMGIRKALGAGVGTLVRSVLTRSVALGVVGVGLGLAGALGASLILGEYLFGIEPWDPLTYGVVAAGTLAFSVLASYLPARRVNRLTPMQVLREE